MGTSVSGDPPNIDAGTTYTGQKASGEVLNISKFFFIQCAIPGGTRSPRENSYTPCCLRKLNADF